MGIEQKDLAMSVGQMDSLLDPLSLVLEREVFLSPLEQMCATREKESQVLIEGQVWVEFPPRDAVQQGRSQIMLFQNSAENGQLPRLQALDLRPQGLTPLPGRNR